MNQLIEFFSNYAYLQLSLLCFIPFLALAAMRKDLFVPMLRTGILVGIIGVLSEIAFFEDYWHPPLLFRIGPFGGLEDFIFGMAVGGSAVALYPLLFSRVMVGGERARPWIVPVVIGVQAIAMLVGHIVHVNSIYASAAGLALTAAISVSVRRDLLVPVLVTALLAAIGIVCLESFVISYNEDAMRRFFMLYGQVPRIFGLAPITELIWSLAFGASTGALYPFFAGVWFQSKGRNNAK